jgi:hypothetical protein
MEWKKTGSVIRGASAKVSNPVMTSDAGYVIRPTLGGRYMVFGPDKQQLTKTGLSKKSAMGFAENHLREQTKPAGEFVANVPPGHDPTDGRQVPPDREESKGSYVGQYHVGDDDEVP